MYQCIEAIYLVFSILYTSSFLHCNYKYLCGDTIVTEFSIEIVTSRFVIITDPHERYAYY